jgi:hypothetical protein
LHPTYEADVQSALLLDRFSFAMKVSPGHILKPI